MSITEIVDAAAETAAPPKPNGKPITTTPGAPPLAQAAELALRSMRMVKAPNMAAFDFDLALETIPYTDRQVKAMEWLLDSGIAAPLSVVPLVTVGVCTACHEHIYVGNKAVPKKCVMRLGCEGTYVKASAIQRRTS